MMVGNVEIMVFVLNNSSALNLTPSTLFLHVPERRAAGAPRAVGCLLSRAGKESFVSVRGAN